MTKMEFKAIVCLMGGANQLEDAREEVMELVCALDDVIELDAKNRLRG